MARPQWLHINRFTLYSPCWSFLVLVQPPTATSVPVGSGCRMNLEMEAPQKPSRIKSENKIMYVTDWLTWLGCSYNCEWKAETKMNPHILESPVSNLPNWNWVNIGLIWNKWNFNAVRKCTLNRVKCNMYVQWKTVSRGKPKIQEGTMGPHWCEEACHLHIFTSSKVQHQHGWF